MFCRRRCSPQLRSMSRASVYALPPLRSSAGCAGPPAWPDALLPAVWPSLCDLEVCRRCSPSAGQLDRGNARGQQPSFRRPFYPLEEARICSRLTSLEVPPPGPCALFRLNLETKNAREDGLRPSG